MNIKGFFIDKLEKNEGYNVIFMKEENSNIFNKIKNKYQNYKLTKSNSNISLVSSKPKDEIINYDLIIFKSCADYSIYASERIRNLVKKIAILRNKPTTGAYQYYDNDSIKVKLFFELEKESKSKVFSVNNEFDDMNLLDLVSYQHYNMNFEKTKIFRK